MPKAIRGANPRGLSRSDLSRCSIAASYWPACTRIKPLAYQPRALLGLSARERSMSAMAVLMSSPPTEDERGVGEDAGVVVGDQRPFRQSDGLVAACHGIFRPTVEAESKVAYATPR